MAVLELNNVHVRYKSVAALKGASLALNENEFVTLMGANGAGKTTLLQSIFGLVKIHQGEIRLNGDIITPHPEKMVTMGVSYVPQGRLIFANLTVFENLEMGGYQLKNKDTLHQRIEETFQTFPLLQEHRKRLAGVLSGGQQQLLALAQGLIMCPRILLLDEPTLGLSPKMVETMLEYIQQIHRQYRMTILVVEHNIESLCEAVDRIYIMEQGLMLTNGTPEELHRQKVWNKIFLGEEVVSS